MPTGIIETACGQPYPKVRPKYVQNPYKVRVLDVPQSVPRNRDVLSRKRGVFSRNKTRTKYVLSGFFIMLGFDRCMFISY